MSRGISVRVVVVLCAIAGVSAPQIAEGARNSSAVAVVQTSNGPFLGSDDQGRAVLESAGGTTKLPFRHNYLSAFSPDGASVATPIGTDDQSADVRVLHAGGATDDLGSVPRSFVDELHWTADGSSVVAKLGANDDGARSLWRFQLGHAPKKLSDLVDISLAPSYAYDPTGDIYYYVRTDAGTGSEMVWALDLRSGTQRKVVDLCFQGCGGDELYIEGIWAVDPSTRRILVDYYAPNSAQSTCSQHCFGWVEPSTGAVTFAATSGSAAGPGNSIDGVQFSVDGQQIALHAYDANDAPFSRVLDHDLGYVASIPGEHSDWQPCPGGSCATFAAPAPPRPKIGAVINGTKGGTVNAGVRWSFTDDENYEFAPATGFDVLWAKVDSKNRTVKSGSFSVAASLRKATKTLAAGRYRFQVRAKTPTKTGQPSSSSAIATAR